MSNPQDRIALATVLFCAALVVAGGFLFGPLGLVAGLLLAVLIGGAS